MAKCARCGRIYFGSKCPFCEKSTASRISLADFGWDDTEKLLLDPEKLGNNIEYFKSEYEKSVKEKGSKDNIKRSVYYCCNLFLLHIKIGETSDALKYCLDMREFAGDRIKGEIDSLAKELEYRLEEGIKISEEFLEKARVIAHQVRMGWK